MKHGEQLFKVFYRATNTSGQFADICARSKNAQDTQNTLSDHGIARSITFVRTIETRSIPIPEEPPIDPLDRKAIEELDKLGEPLTWEIIIEKIYF